MSAPTNAPGQLARAINAARAHHAYRWARSPGSHQGPTWTSEEFAAYHEEWDRLNGKPSPYCGSVRVDLPDNTTDSERATVRAKAAELNTSLHESVFPSYREALDNAARAVAASGCAGRLIPMAGTTYPRT